MTSIADMSQELTALWDEKDKLEMRQRGRDVTDRQRQIADAQEDAVLERIYALEALMVVSRAVDERDALAQIMLACNHAGTIMDCDCKDGGKAEAQKVQTLLQSAVAALEDVHGFDRDDYGGGLYAPRRLDPHLMEDAA